jgi:hypothetical protein
MAPSNKIWTLKDVTNDGAVDEPTIRTVPATKNTIPNPFSSGFCQPTTPGVTGDSIPKLCHIPNLPLSDVCQATLLRIQQEFEPIVRQRGYKVLSVSEMCCCGDGLDHQTTGRKRKPLRKQSPNVWGYNRTTFGRVKTHTIHLRLRDPHDHNRLLPWEDVAGTMAHELSHCVHQNHAAPFYKLMEEILEQHCVLQTNTATMNFAPLNAASVNRVTTENTTNAETTASLPTTGGQTLGGAKKGKSRLLQQPQRGSQLGGGVKLGGAGTGGAKSQRALREAAARAAEARRRQMDQVRRMIERSKEPCIIEILDGDSDDDYESSLPNNTNANRHSTQSGDATSCDSKLSATRRKREHSSERPADSKPPARAASKAVSDSRDTKPAPITKRPKSLAVIDLTEGEADDTKPLAVASAPSSSPSCTDWSCSKCTFLNRPLALACSMCRSERVL